MAGLLRMISFLFRSTEESRYSRAWVVVIMAAGVVGGVASTGLLALINSALNAADGISEQLAWGFVGLCVALPLSRFVSQSLLVRLSQGIALELRMRLSERILATPLRRLEKVGAARLFATLTDDVARITGAFGGLPQLFLHLTVVLGCLTYMGWLSWRLLLAVLATVALGVVSYQFPVMAAQRHFRSARERWDQVFAAFRGLTDGTKELKIHRPRRRAFLDQVLEPGAEDLRRHNVIGGTIYAMANSWGQILFFILIGVVLFIVPRYLPLSQEVLTGYTLAILYMLTPLDVLLGQIPGLGQAAVAVKKVEELGLSLTDPAEAGTDPEPVGGEDAWQRLSLRGVQHTFYREVDDDTFTLGPVDLEVERGELLFVVGGNGSGKTTLAKLLVGLYAPEEGAVCLDGTPVGDRDRDEFRQLFSVVFSDFYLFESLLGIETERLDEQARGYLETLHLAHKVKVEEGALSTLDLSQGQRKRLALLTAYLEDRSIYVFDEWAADQDPHFKQIFYLQLLPELQRRGKTVVVISHDDRYYGLAQRIVKLDAGQVVFDGGVESYLEAYARRPLLGVGGEPEAASPMEVRE